MHSSYVNLKGELTQFKPILSNSPLIASSYDNLYLFLRFLPLPQYGDKWKNWNGTGKITKL